MKRRKIAALAAGAIALALVGCSGGSGPDTAGSDEGASGFAGETLTVTTLSYYPFCGTKGDELVGIDVDVMNKVSENLGFEVEYKVTDAAGQIAGIESKRDDITICDLGWTKERAGISLLPDPLYYVPVMLTFASDSPTEYKSIDDVKGKRVGLINGYGWNEAFSNLEGVEASTYPDAAAVLADLAAGRIDVAPTDPLVTDVAIAERPDWELRSNLLTPPSAEQLESDPALVRLLPTQAGWMVSKEHPELEKAISEEIQKLSASGELAEIYEKWGVPDVEAWLTVPGDYIRDQRVGVDRDESWNPPSWP